MTDQTEENKVDVIDITNTSSDIDNNKELPFTFWQEVLSYLPPLTRPYYRFMNRAWYNEVVKIRCETLQYKKEELVITGQELGPTELIESPQFDMLIRWYCLYVKKLSLNCLSGFTEWSLINCPILQVVEVGFSCYKSMEMGWFLTFLRLQPTIKKLILLEPYENLLLTKLVECTPNLIELILSYNNKRLENLDNFFNFLATSNLTSLTLALKFLDLNFFDTITEALPKLKTLSLSSDYLKTDGKLFNFITYFPNLQSFTLCLLHKPTIYSFGTFHLDKLPQLKRLTFNHYFMVTGVTFCPTLEYLKVDNFLINQAVSITDTCLYLKELVLNCSNLGHLTLSCLLSRLYHLRTVTLYQIDTPDYLYSFGDIQYNITHLTLDLLVPITSHSLEYLVRRLPHLFHLQLFLLGLQLFSDMSCQFLTLPELVILTLPHLPSLPEFDLLATNAPHLENVNLSIASYQDDITTHRLRYPNLNFIIPRASVTFLPCR